MGCNGLIGNFVMEKIGFLDPHPFSLVTKFDERKNFNEERKKNLRPHYLSLIIFIISAIFGFERIV